MMHKKISRAFISVSDRTGLIELAKKLVEQEVEIIATDGTAAHLKASGIATKSVEQVTGFTQVLDDGLLATVFFLTAFLATVFLGATFLVTVFFTVGLSDLLFGIIYKNPSFLETLKENLLLCDHLIH